MKIDNRNNVYGSADKPRAGGGRPSVPIRGYGMHGGSGQTAPAASGQLPQQQVVSQQATQAACQYEQSSEQYAPAPQGAPMQAAQCRQAPYGQHVPNQPEQRKKKRPVGFWIAIVVAILCVVLAAVIAFSMFGPGKGARQGDAGQLDGKTAEEIQAELDRIVEEGMFNISIASVVQFPDGASPGELRIENVPGNQYLMRVEITRDDTGEMIYSTDFIEPNHHIQSDKLNADLPQGSYPSTATFYAYDAQTEELVGQAAAKVTIDVLS